MTKEREDEIIEEARTQAAIGQGYTWGIVIPLLLERMDKLMRQRE